MLEKEKTKQISKWVIGVVTICILIYLGFGNIGSIAKVLNYMINIVKPLLIGVIWALVLNVPMSFIEVRLLEKLKLEKGRRPIAILISVILVLGLFVGSALLIIPELVEAIKIILHIVTKDAEQMKRIETEQIEIKSVQNLFNEVNINWSDIRDKMEGWLLSKREDGINYVMKMAGSVVDGIITVVIGLFFSIYILAQKESLRKQACRFIRIWLPQKVGNYIIYATDSSAKIFKLFIVGQATEAIVLGVLCLIGMVILNIPYAPTISALIGVTALIPLAGAYIGTIVGAIIIFTIKPFKSLVFIVFILILQQVEGNGIYPRMVGSKINLPAMWVLVAIVVGGNMAGPLGMFLGVPITASIYALLKEATDKREIKLNIIKDKGRK